MLRIQGVDGFASETRFGASKLAKPVPASAAHFAQPSRQSRGRDSVPGRTATNLVDLHLRQTLGRPHEWRYRKSIMHNNGPVGIRGIPGAYTPIFARKDTGWNLIPTGCRLQECCNGRSRARRPPQPEDPNGRENHPVSIRYAHHGGQASISSSQITSERCFASR
jgi:hypothetical protein